MKYSMTVPVWQDTIFSPFQAERWEEALEWTAEAGFAGAELCVSDSGRIQRDRIHRRLERLGLRCPTLSTGQAAETEGLSLLEEEVWRKTEQRIREHIDFAAELGSMVTIGRLRGNGKGMSREKAHETLARRMERLVGYAERKQAVLLIEGLNRYECRFWNTGEEILQFRERYFGGTGTIKILWDSFHANIEEQDLTGSLRKLGNALGHVHLADSNRRLPGRGHTDFEKIFRELSDLGYPGFCSYECLTEKNADPKDFRPYFSQKLCGKSTGEGEKAEK